MESLYFYAVKYYKKWRVTPIPTVYKNDMQPLVRWSNYYNKNELVLVKEKWKEATGIAILPCCKHVVVDIDVFKNEEERLITAEWLRKHDYAVVLTRRGLHIHFNIKKEQIGEIRLYRNNRRAGEGGGALYKHLWTVPPTRRNNFIYKFYNYDEDDVPDLPTLYDLEDFYDDISLVLHDLKYVVVKHNTITGSSMMLEGVDPIAEIDKLNEDGLLALLAGIYHALNCQGLRDLVLEWITTGSVKMRKFGWSNRTSRFYFLHTIAATLALLGASEQQVAALLNKYEDVDGKPADAHQSALYTVFKWRAPLNKRLYVLKRGECPFCTLKGYKNCMKNPVMRVYYWLQSRRGRETTVELVRYILEKRKVVANP